MQNSKKHIDLPKIIKFNKSVNFLITILVSLHYSANFGHLTQVQHYKIFLKSLQKSLLYICI